MTDEQVLGERTGKAFAKKIAACKEAIATVLAIIACRRPDGIDASAERGWDAGVEKPCIPIV
jgi:hypothetical protein